MPHSVHLDASLCSPRCITLFTMMQNSVHHDASLCSPWCITLLPMMRHSVTYGVFIGHIWCITHYYTSPSEKYFIIYYIHIIYHLVIHSSLTHTSYITHLPIIIKDSLSPIYRGHHSKCINLSNTTCKASISMTTIQPPGGSLPWVSYGQHTRRSTVLSQSSECRSQACTRPAASPPARSAPCRTAWTSREI